MFKPAGGFTTFAGAQFNYPPWPVLSSRRHAASIMIGETGVHIMGLSHIDARVHNALYGINVEHNLWPTGRSHTAWSKRARDSMGQFSRRKASFMIRMTSASFGFALAVTKLPKMTNRCKQPVRRASS